MTRRLHIRPAEGRLVRDHLWPHPFIPAAGCLVDEHPYWWRKLVRGDVVLVPAVEVTVLPAPDEEPVAVEQE